MNGEDRRHTQRRFILALSLTASILVAEIIGGLWTGSLALLSDAAHVFLDVFALGMSYFALRLAALPPNERHTFGFQRMQVLAALANGATLLFISLEIFHEAWLRFRTPSPVLAGPMMVVAVTGLLVNLLVALVLREHDHADLNVRSAFLHVLGDALASVGVIAAGVVILLTGWTFVDPLVSVFIGLIVLLGSYRLLRETVHILAEGMPAGITSRQVIDALLRTPGVLQVHDLHIWTVSPGYAAMSAHVVLGDQPLSDTRAILAALNKTLAETFDIQHTTIQFECESCEQGMVTCLSGG